MNGEIINFLDRYTKSGTPVKDLSRFENLMHRLGDPQDRLEYVHIAGTNGKGSAARMLANSLTLAGYTTGEFTSPFIYSYNDRIKINGEEISDRELMEIIGMIKPVVEGDIAGYSQFEITNAIAFMYFARHKCDIVVLETGVGGLVDSTNIIKDNVCSVIMSISYDHTAILGDTIEKIAFQKAGIIKDECPVVMYPDNPVKARDVVEKYAMIHGSRMIVPDMNRIRFPKVTPEGCSFFYGMREYRTKMTGEHQIYNAVTVIEAANIIRKRYPSLKESVVAEGIATAVMPSRCQIIRRKDPMIIIDGAHNPDGMRALSEFIRTLPNYPKVMICGMSADKEWEKALSYISPLIDKAFCIDGFCPKTVFAPKLAACFSDAECVPISEVYHRAYVCAGNTGLLLIGGSLYIPSALNKFSK
ncbi:MAG: bifunctional folylpolyglutamate synthase/dihydrofolate synthase [Huintestinicola sp.]